MRKFLFIFLLSFVVVILGSCGTSSDSQSFTVGMECAYAPYNWTTPTKTGTAVKIDGSIAYCDGYDIKMAQTLADTLGKPLVVKAIEWDGLIPALKSGEIDAIIAGMSPTDARKLKISFTDSYFRSEQVVVVKKGSSYEHAQSINDFSQAEITAQLGTLQEALTSQLIGATQATSLNDYPTMVTALTSGTVDGFIAELPVATQIVNNNTNLTIVRFSEGNGFEVDDAQVTSAIGLRKSDTELLNQLNTALATISVDTRNTWMDQYVALSSSAE